MIEIKCLKDIKQLAKSGKIPAELVNYLVEDLKVIHHWDDFDHEWTLETFNCDYTNNGYIAIVEGNENVSELEEIGLTGGLEKTIPEDAVIYHMGGEKFTRSIVIYNDSFAMILWLRNLNVFDSYASVA